MESRPSHKLLFAVAILNVVIFSFYFATNSRIYQRTVSTQDFTTITSENEELQIKFDNAEKMSMSGEELDIAQSNEVVAVLKNGTEWRGVDRKTNKEGKEFTVDNLTKVSPTMISGGPSDPDVIRDSTKFNSFRSDFIPSNSISGFASEDGKGNSGDGHADFQGRSTAGRSNSNSGSTGDINETKRSVRVSDDVRTQARGFPDREIPDYLADWKPLPSSPNYFLQMDGNELWLYSAFFDGFGPRPLVRAFGIVNTALPRNVFCHFLDAGKKYLYSSSGFVDPYRVKPEFMYVSTDIVCMVKNDDSPRYIVVSFKDKFEEQNIHLQIQYPGTRLRNFTVCFSALHSNYNMTFQLVQAIEMNKILGASHFFIYNFSVSSFADAVLQHYQQKGLVTVMQWPLPVIGSWYYGQYAAINDCIYRNRITSQFVILQDTDEFIIPTKHSDWWHMIRDVIQDPKWRELETSKQSPLMEVGTAQNVPKFIQFSAESTDKVIRNSLFGGFSFRHVIYPWCISQTDDELKRLNITESEIEFLRKFPTCLLLQMGTNEAMKGPEVRSKMIIRPETVLRGSIHKMIEYRRPYGVALVNQETAVLQHHHTGTLRTRCKTMDVAVLRFKDRLISGIRKIADSFPFISTAPTADVYEASRWFG